MAEFASTDTPAAPRSPVALALGAVVSRLVILVPYLWLLALFLVPFLIVVKISLSQTAVAMPPYQPVIGFSEGISGFFSQLRELSFDNYVWLTADAGERRFCERPGSAPHSRENRHGEARKKEASPCLFNRRILSSRRLLDSGGDLKDEYRLTTPVRV